MSTQLMRPLSLGEALDTSFAMYRRLFVQLLGISVVTQGLPLAMGVYISAAGGPFFNLALWIPQIVLALTLGALGTAASTFVISEYYLGRTIDTAAALRNAVAFLGRIIVLTFATALVVGVGFVFLFIPGLILLSGLVLGTPALVIENLPDASSAMRRSWSLSRSFRWKVFSAYFLGFVLLVIPTIAVAFVVGRMTDMTETSTAALVAQVLGAMLRILAYPFIYVVTTILYYDLRVRKEGFDLEMLASTLQPA